MPIWRIFNGPMPTTSKLAPVACPTSAVGTMLQLKSVTGLYMKVKGWGCSMDGSAGAAGVAWELLETGTVFGTGATAFVAADFHAKDAIAKLATATDYFSVGTSASGYSPSAEGTITATRLFDSQLVQPTGQYAWEFSLGNEPIVVAVSALRIRCKAPAAVNGLCWVDVEM